MGRDGAIPTVTYRQLTLSTVTYREIPSYTVNYRHRSNTSPLTVTYRCLPVSTVATVTYRSICQAHFDRFEALSAHGLPEAAEARAQLKASLGAPLMPFEHGTVEHLGAELGLADKPNNATSLGELAAQLQARLLATDVTQRLQTLRSFRRGCSRQT